MAVKKQDVAAATAAALPTAKPPQLVKKISAKTVCSKIDKPTEPVALFNLYGVAHGIKTGDSQYGAWTAFIGNFEALNLKTGERFLSGAAFVPGVVEQLLLSGLTAAQEADANASIQFALQIGVKPAMGSKPSTTGYEYTVTPLVDIQANDPLAALKNQLAQIGYGG